MLFSVLTNKFTLGILLVVGLGVGFVWYTNSVRKDALEDARKDAIIEKHEEEERTEDGITDALGDGVSDAVDFLRRNFGSSSE